MNDVINKTFDVSETGDAGVFAGYVAVFGNIDLQGDVIRKGAFAGSVADTQTVPVMWNHDGSRPNNVIGKTISAVEDDHGLLITARLDLGNPVAAEAYRLLKNATVSKMSVGMVAEQAEWSGSATSDRHRVITKARLLECSLTPTPANPMAEVVTVKSATNNNKEQKMADTVDIQGTVSVNKHVDDAPDQQQDANAAKDYKPETKPAPIETKNVVADIAAASEAFGTPEDTTGTKYFNFKSMAELLPKAARDYSAKMGITKGIVSDGATVVGVPLINTTPIPGDAAVETAPRMIDHIPVIVRTAPVYDALIEKPAETPGGAAVVADGAEKPVTDMLIDTVEKRLKVIATVSSPISKYTLQDNANLQAWIGSKLTESVRNALEKEVLTGSGAEGHMTGLATITGTQSQDFKNSYYDTIAAALNKLDMIGVAGSMIVMSPADWLNVQSYKDADGHYYMADGIADPVTRRIFGVQVYVSAAMTAGTAYVIGQDALNISSDGNITVEWNPYGGFTRNQVIARAEARYELDVLRPQRIVKTTIEKPTTK